MISEMLYSLDLSVAFILQQVADLSDEDLMEEQPRAANHAGWTLGHIIYGLQTMVEELGGEPWLSNDWESLFAFGSSPSLVKSDRFSKISLVGALTNAYERLRAALLETGESALGEPYPDEETRKRIPTLGHAFIQIVVAHTAYHAGQLAAWRRAIGRPPVGVFM